MKYEYNDTWTYDLEFGQLQGEEYIVKMMSGSKVEVKADRMTLDTGNLYFEYECRGKLSGISTTKADYLCYKVNDWMVLTFEVVKLKEALKVLVKNGEAKMDVKGGDDKASRGILINIGKLLKAINNV